MPPQETCHPEDRHAAGRRLPMKRQSYKKHVTLSERVPPSESKGLPMVSGSLQPSAGRCRLELGAPSSDEIEDLQRVTVRVFAVSLDPLCADDEGCVLAGDSGEVNPVAHIVRDHVEAAEL